MDEKEQERKQEEAKSSFAKVWTDGKKQLIEKE
jgi:hypothetical protein